MKKKRRERDDTRCFVVNLITRVVDPYSFFTDPDPELDVGGQYGSGSRALMTKNWEKITAENFFKFFFDQKLQFTYP
jgi:hypothetical protein